MEELGISFDLPPKYTVAEAEEGVHVISNAQGAPLVRIYDIAGWDPEETFEGWLADEGMTLEGATAIMAQQDDTDPYKLVRSGKNGCGGYTARYESVNFYDAFGLCQMGEKKIFCSADTSTFDDDANNIMLICESVRPMDAVVAESDEA